jgi:hypothetical protein
LTLVKTKLLLGITVHGKDTLLWQGYSYKSLFCSSTFARWSFGKESFSLGQAKSQRKRAALLAWNTYVNVLSLVDRVSSGSKGHEVDLRPLILEAAPERKGVYRWVDIARKSVYVSDDEFVCLTGTEASKMQWLGPFSSWDLKTVEII